MIKKKVLLKVNDNIETFIALIPQYKSNQLTKYSVFAQTVIIWLTRYSVFC